MRLRQLSFFSRPPMWAGGIGLFLVTLLCACGGGGGVSTTPVSATIQTASLPAAMATGCIPQSAAAQTATLPAAGGISGSISLGATGASGTCLGVTVATGADATLQATRAAAATVRRGAAATATAAPSPLPPALAQVSLTNAYTGNLTWIAMTLQLPGTVPPGQYPATITSTNDIDGTVDTSVANFTVTVSASGQAVVTGPSASQFLAILAADTTGVLAIYPPGTVLPTPVPLPLTTPSPGASASAAPSASPTATAAPTTAPTASPAPTVAPTTAAFKLTISPSACVDAGNTGPTFNYQVFPNVPPPAGAQYLYRWYPLSIYGSRWTITVPVTLTDSTYGALTTSDKASITVPIYATINDINGESGGIAVQAFYYYPSAGTHFLIQDSTGHTVIAGAPIAAGTVTCHGLGL